MVVIHTSLIVLASCLQLVSVLEPPAPGCWIVGQNHQDTCSNEDAKGDAKNTNPQDSVSSLVKPQPQASAAQSSEPSDQDQQAAAVDYGSFSDWVIVLFTGALTLFALFQLIVINRQTRIFDEQSRIMNKQNEIADDQKAIMKAEQRARMAVFGTILHHLTRDHGNDGSFMLDIRAENLGQTPAIVTGIVCDAAPKDRTNDIKTFADRVELLARGQDRTRLVSPKHSFEEPYRFPISLSDAEFDDMESDFTATILVVVCVCYWDIFRDHQITTTVWNYRPHAQVLKTNDEYGHVT